MQPSDYTAIARLLRPQGRKGELLAEMLTDFPERFKTTTSVMLENPKGEPTPATLEDHWFPMGKNAGKIVLKLAGIDSINDAELLNGKMLLIHDDDRVTLGEDETWTSDLIGCELVHGDHVIGEVVQVQPMESPDAAPLLVVQKAGSEDELLIPFAKAYILSIDIAAKRIVMNLPDGLLDING